MALVCVNEEFEHYFIVDTPPSSPKVKSPKVKSSKLKYLWYILKLIYNY